MTSSICLYQYSPQTNFDSTTFRHAPGEKEIPTNRPNTTKENLIMEQPRLSSMLRACLAVGTADYDWQQEYTKRQAILQKR